MTYSRDLQAKPFDPGFCPQLRPAQMLKMGIFGGTYFARRPRDWRELPATWRRRVEQLLPESKYKSSLNRFLVRSGLSFAELEAQRLAQADRSARMVSVVLPVHARPALPGRPAPDQALAELSTARRSARGALPPPWPQAR